MARPGEPGQGEYVVADRVLADGRVYAHGYGERPRNQDGEPGERDRDPQPVAYLRLDRPDAVGARTGGHGEAGVAPEQVPSPLKVPDVLGLVQAQVTPQVLGDLGAVSGRSRVHQVVHDGVGGVARGQLDDYERQYRNHPDGEQGENEPSCDVPGHVSSDPGWGGRAISTGGGRAHRGAA